ncbi:MAG: hypothetical protein IH595_00535 [Bacteroidales bacterium]|nr:hypothetical protein [Bacteroidales bacterium]
MIISLGILTLISASCKRHGTKDNIPLAKVGDKYLYESDLEGLIPKDTKPNDSILISRSYINKWVQTQLLLQEAENNLPPDKLDFEKQLEEYRNSLIIYHYETEYVNQHLDTVVTDNDIKDYYQSHLKDFQLKQNIVKVIYAVLSKKNDKGKRLEYNFKRIFRLPDSILLDSLDRYAPARALTFSTDTNTWIPFDEVLKVIPIETYNQELYLKNHRIIFITDADNDYLLKFVNFKIKDETSPLDLENRFIRSIILNIRKKILINNLQQEIYNQAKQQKEFEIF